MNLWNFDTNGLNRRTLIKRAAQSLLGVSALGALQGRAIGGEGPNEKINSVADHFGQAKAVIYIYLWGGISQIDSFDPKPGTDVQGPVETLKTNADGVLVSEYFPNLARQMDKVCVVRSMKTSQGEHQQGSYYMRTSYQVHQTTSHPGLGAWGSHFLGPNNPDLPANVRIGGHHGNRFWGGFLNPKHSALPIVDPVAGLRNCAPPESVTSSRQARRLARVRDMNRKFVEKNPTHGTKAHVELFDEAVHLMKSREIDSFDLGQEAKEKRERYGNNSLGQGCLLAKRLVERGVRFVEVNDRDWDTHIFNFRKMEEKGPVLDQALAALLQDLATSGMLDETLVVVGTEFGRTPTIDTNFMGRDHYPQAFSCLLAGGGIAGGRAFGDTGKEGREIVDREVSIPDFNATIAHSMGLPLDKKVISPTNRPFTVANQGKPVMDLFG